MAEEYKVLIADDSSFARRLVRSYLQDTEFNVVAEAANGLEAVARFKEQSPDLVVLDIIMPEQDGAAALGQLIQLDPNARVVMLSSLGTEDAVSQCLAAGAKTFIQKPFEKDVLLKSLRSLVAE